MTSARHSRTEDFIRQININDVGSTIFKTLKRRMNHHVVGAATTYPTHDEVSLSIEYRTGCQRRRGRTNDLNHGGNAISGPLFGQRFNQ